MTTPRLVSRPDLYRAILAALADVDGLDVIQVKRRQDGCVVRLDAGIDWVEAHFSAELPMLDVPFHVPARINAMIERLLPPAYPPGDPAP